MDLDTCRDMLRRAGIEFEEYSEPSIVRIRVERGYYRFYVLATFDVETGNLLDMEAYE